MAGIPFRTALRQLRQLLGTQPRGQGSDEHLVQRFVAQRDENAFAALVQRHGSLVLGVCRRVLTEPSDVEDAFQATFLILVRKAGSIAYPERLGSWLYGVAYRVASRARLQAARRRASESQADGRTPVDPAAAVAWRELGPLLDEEVHRLPEKYRLPFILCHLEGKTNDEAARCLGCPKGTVLSRLARARERLRNRLVQRGVTWTGAGLAALLAENSVSASVPRSLAAATASAAVPRGAGTATPAALSLAEGVMKAMFLTRVKSLGLGLLVLAVAGVSLGTLTHWALAEKQPPAQPSPERAPPAAADENALARKPAPAAKKADPAADDPLPAGAIARLGRLRFRHGEVIRCLAFSPDGKLLASAGENLFVEKDMEERTICLWDVQSGRERARLQGQGTLWSLAYSPDGTLLAATSSRGVGVEARGQLLLWDVATGKQRRRIPGPHRPWMVLPVAFSPDGKTLAFESESGKLCLWETATGKEIRALPTKGNICSLAFAPKGKILVVGDYGGVLHRWSLETGEELKPVPAHNKWIRTVAFSADGKLLASLTAGGELRLWEADTLEPLASFDKPLTSVVSVAFAPREATLAVLRTLRPEAEPLPPNHKDPQPRPIATQAIQLWNVVRGGNPIRTIPITARASDRHFNDYWDSLRTQNNACFVTFSPDGNSLATADRDGSIRLWDPARGKEQVVSAASQQAVRALAWGRKSKTLFSGGDSPTVQVWDPRTGEERRSIAIRTGAELLCLSHDEKRLATADGLTVSVWGTEDGKLSSSFMQNAQRRNQVRDERIVALAFAADDKSLAVVSSHTFDTGHILGPVTGDQWGQWDLATGKPLHPARMLSSHGGPLRCVFSADGQSAAGSRGGGLFLRDVAGDKETVVSRERSLAVQVLALAPNGKMLATGAWQPGRPGGFHDTSSITLWDLEKQEAPQPSAKRTAPKPDPRIRELAKHPGHVTALALSANGKLLASATQHPQDPRTTLRLWDVATGKELQRWEGHRDRVNALVFSPIGDRLASASSDGTILVWKVE